MGSVENHLLPPALAPAPIEIKNIFSSCSLDPRRLVHHVANRALLYAVALTGLVLLVSWYAARKKTIRTPESSTEFQLLCSYGNRQIEVFAWCTSTSAFYSAEQAGRSLQKGIEEVIALDNGRGISFERLVREAFQQVKAESGDFSLRKIRVVLTIKIGSESYTERLGFAFVAPKSGWLVNYFQPS